MQYWRYTGKINRMLKKASGKAAGSEAPGAYMEVREEAERLRTPLVAFFSILLNYDYRSLDECRFQDNSSRSA